METAAHLRLKMLAVAFLHERGCQAIATEVACPIAKFRIDVAGYVDGKNVQRFDWRSDSPVSIAIECKQSRSDFLRDCEELTMLLELREKYEAMRRSICENRIKTIEPHLQRRGTSLFAELEDWDFASSNLPGYRKVMRRLRVIDQKIHGETKFFTMSKYHLADRLYLAAPPGIIGPCELPLGWGLLEVNEATNTLCMVREAPARNTRPDHRLRMLRNIAVAGSRRFRLDPTTSQESAPMSESL